MSKYQLPYFEEIELTETQDYYEIYIEFDGNTIQLDINNGSDFINQDKMDNVKMFLENLSNYKIKANSAIINDFKNEETVKEYVEHHLEVIDETELEIILATQDQKSSKEKQLLTLLHLKRIGFYLDDENEFAIFDYTIGREITDYLVVVKFNYEGEIELIEMES